MRSEPFAIGEDGTHESKVTEDKFFYFILFCNNKHSLFIAVLLFSGQVRGPRNAHRPLPCLEWYDVLTPFAGSPQGVPSSYRYGMASG